MSTTRARQARTCVVLFALIVQITASTTVAERPTGAGDATGDCASLTALRADFRVLCDTIAAGDVSSGYIFIKAYLMRTLVAGYRLLGDSHYLDVAVENADRLVASQRSEGYWRTTPTSPNIYLADTGSAIGLFIALDDLVDEQRRATYRDAARRHVAAIIDDGLVHPSGALGTGFRWSPRERRYEIYPDSYTISSALSGGMVFAWVHHLTSDPGYEEIAVGALRWIFTLTREDGRVPYVLAGEGGDLERKDEPLVSRVLWEQWPYNTAAYVGEGVIAFDRFIDDTTATREVRDAVRPLVEHVLDTQNDDGTWAQPLSEDQKRSPGVINLLAWYYRRVEADPRIPDAICRFATALTDPEMARSIGMWPRGTEMGVDTAIITGIAGRAMADMLVGPDQNFFF